MRIQRTSKIITAVIIALSLLAIACAFVSRHYRRIEEQSYEKRRKMHNYTEQLARGSDNLTSAVRAYAATGDRRHYDAFLRELNEDTYYGDSELGLWLVADGMGGHEYGEVASALARETIVECKRLVPRSARPYHARPAARTCLFRSSNAPERWQSG